MPGNYVREKWLFTDTDGFPPKILTAAHLSSLRDLLSDKKLTGEIFVVVAKICFLKQKSNKTPVIIASIYYFTCWTIVSNDLHFSFSQNSLYFFHSSLGPSDHSPWSTRAPRPSTPPLPVQRGQSCQRLVMVNGQSLLLKVPCHAKAKANPSFGMPQMAPVAC